MLGQVTVSTFFCALPLTDSNRTKNITGIDKRDISNNIHRFDKHVNRFERSQEMGTRETEPGETEQ